MTEDLQRLRSLLGASAAFWAGAEGVRLNCDRWSALSGARAVDYNVILCHGDDGGAEIEAGLGEIAAASVPAVAMVAGVALRDVQKLVELGWVCIGAVPFMRCELRPAANPDLSSSVRRLEPGRLSEAHLLVAEVFGVGLDLATVAIPPDATETENQAVWGAYDDADQLVACLAAVRREETVVIWSMATASGARRRGYGAMLLRAALEDAARDGAKSSLLYASPQGEPFYRALGYRELERWQQWSRPRWVLGRA